MQDTDPKPVIDISRTVQIWTPGGLMIPIEMPNLLPAASKMGDSDLARLYCSLTDLRVTIVTSMQTTVSPLKAQEPQDV